MKCLVQNNVVRKVILSIVVCYVCFLLPGIHATCKPICCAPSLPDTTVMVRNNQRLPGDFWLADEQGKKINIRRLKGKVIFVNFWALTCIPCKEEMPSINKLASAFIADTNVVIMSVNLDSDLKAPRTYFNDNKYSLNLYAIAGAVPDPCFRGILPTTLVIDKQGRIAFFTEGMADYGTKKFIELIAALATK